MQETSDAQTEGLSQAARELWMEKRRLLLSEVASIEKLLGLRAKPKPQSKGERSQDGK